jgi:hypothetical protein
MRKLTDKELISTYFAINVYNEYFFNGLMFFENTEYEINKAFGSPYKALKAVSDSYSVSEPYFYVLGGRTLISLTEDRLVNILRDNETEIVQIYEALVEQGEFEDFLNFSEDERELTDDQLEKLFEEVGAYVDYWSMHENDEDGFEGLFENGLEVARAVKYGDYDYTKPYVKLGNDGNLYSLDRGEYLEELREGKDDLLQIYDELVKDGGIEDFLKEEEE